MKQELSFNRFHFNKPRYEIRKVPKKRKTRTTTGGPPRRISHIPSDYDKYPTLTPRLKNYFQQKGQITNILITAGMERYRPAGREGRLMAYTLRPHRELVPGLLAPLRSSTAWATMTLTREYYCIKIGHVCFPRHPKSTAVYRRKHAPSCFELCISGGFPWPIQETKARTQSLYYNQPGNNTFRLWEAKLLSNQSLCS